MNKIASKMYPLMLGLMTSSCTLSLIGILTDKTWCMIVAGIVFIMAMIAWLIDDYYADYDNTVQFYIDGEYDYFFEKDCD